MPVNSIPNTAPLPFSKTASALEHANTDAGTKVDKDVKSLSPGTRLPAWRGWGALNRLLFLWVTPLTEQGYKRELDERDMFLLPTELKPAQVAREIRRHWSVDEAGGTLAGALCAMQRPAILLGVAMNIVTAACRIAQPVAIGRIIDYLDAGTGATVSRSEAFGQVGVLLLTSLLAGLLQAQYFQLGRCHIGMRAVSACSALIFDKSLRTSASVADAEAHVGGGLPPVKSTVADASQGSADAGDDQGEDQKEENEGKGKKPSASREGGSARGKSGSASEVNLVSADATHLLEGFFWVIRTAEYLPIIVAAIVLLFRNLGSAAAPGLAVLACAMYAQSHLAKCQHRHTKRQLGLTDTRITLTQQALLGIKLVKFGGQEQLFEARIRDARAHEVVELRKVRVLIAWNEFLTGATSALVALVTFGAFVAIEGSAALTARRIFVSMALFNLLRQPLTFIPLIVEMAMKMSVSFSRMERYLRAAEVSALVGEPNTESTHQKVGPDEARLFVSPDATFAWPSTASHFALSHAGLNLPSTGSVLSPVPKAERERNSGAVLCVVVGPVGCGKSSLLSAILSEIPATNGTAVTTGSTAYASQTPWIMHGSVRENVIFDCVPPPAEKHTDSAAFESRYRRVLSACALDTDLQSLPAHDETVIGEKGVNISGGQRQRVSLARATMANAQIVLLDDPLSALDARVADHVFDECICKLLLGRGGCSPDAHANSSMTKIVVLVTHQLSVLPHADHIVVMDAGRIVAQGRHNELLEAGGDVTRLLQHAEVPAKPAEPQAVNRTNVAAPSSANPSVPSVTAAASKMGGDTACKAAKSSLVVAESRARGMVSADVMRSYVRFSGGSRFVLKVALMNVLVESTLACADWWLALWIKANKAEPNTPVHVLGQSVPLPGSSSFLGFFVGGYAAWCLSNAAFFLQRAIVFVQGAVRAACECHDRLLHGVIYAPLTFFDANPSGRVMNRFGPDLFEIEQMLPRWTEHANQCAARVTMVVVACAVVLPWLLVLLPPSIIVFLRVLRLYSRSFRQLQRMVQVSRSPVLSLFGQTIDGRDTVRAFSAQGTMRKRFHDVLDAHLRARLTTFSVQNWQAIRVSVLGAVFSAATALLAVISKGTLAPAVAALALNFSLSLTFYLMGLIFLVASAEATLTSCERVLEYANTCAEAPHVVPGEDEPEVDTRLWLKRGPDVVFDDVSAHYAPHLPPALRGANLEIPGSKLTGIVGRSGAGKSTLVATLFRVIELSTGTIEIGGINIASLGLRRLRQSLGVILQEPVLTGQTVRLNLDPHGEHNDDEVWHALELASLGDVVRKLPGALDALVEEGGQNFSVGTRQLLCMARALVQQCGVLVLDEATSSLDQQTDTAIQDMVRQHFLARGVTVIVVAHRLGTVIGADKIFVMDHGAVVESGRPADLLNVENGHFTQLVDATGSQTAADLRKRAKGNSSQQATAVNK